jgi:tetratricopeptide (TPR) repeat protein
MTGLSLVMLNNTGVRCLIEADVQAAISYFTEAVHLASEALPCGLSGTSGRNVFFTTSDDKKEGQSPDPFTSVTIFGSVVANDTTDTFSGIYQRAYLLSDDFDPIKNPVAFSTILLYNLALAYQHLSLVKTGTTLTNVKAALRCYKSALNLLRREDMANHLESRFLLALAVLNNLREIFLALDKPKEANSCDSMMGTLMDSQDVPISFGTGDDMEFFYFGHFCRVYGMPPTMSAAAAA